LMSASSKSKDRSRRASMGTPAKDIEENLEKSEKISKSSTTVIKKRDPAQRRSMHIPSPGGALLPPASFGKRRVSAIDVTTVSSSKRPQSARVTFKGKQENSKEEKHSSTVRSNAGEEKSGTEKSSRRKSQTKKPATKKSRADVSVVDRDDEDISFSSFEPDNADETEVSDDRSKKKGQLGTGKKAKRKSRKNDVEEAVQEDPELDAAPQEISSNSKKRKSKRVEKQLLFEDVPESKKRKIQEKR